MKWKHDDLAKDLAEHLQRNTDRIIWTDMQLGPARSPRPDVYSIPKSYSGFKPLAYECKVSVSDFRSDITKGKWQSYLKFASGVIFAVPKGLITKDDVPKGCGLIIRSENGWRMAKGPTLVPVANDLPKDFWIKLVIDGVNRSLLERRYTLGIEHTTNQKISKKYGEELGIALSKRDQAQKKLDYRTAELQKQLGDIDLIWHVERQKEKIEADKQNFEELHHDLCSLLGLPPQSEYWTIRSALNDQKKMLAKDSHVQKCQVTMTRMLSTLKDKVSELETLCSMVAADGDSDGKPQ